MRGYSRDDGPEFDVEPPCTSRWIARISRHSTCIRKLGYEKRERYYFMTASLEKPQ